MDKKDAKQVAEILRDLAKYGPKNSSFGICFNLQDALEKAGNWNIRGYAVVSAYSRGWAHHTGCASFPVQDFSETAKWQGRGLELRLDLCEYIAKQMDSIAENGEHEVEIKSARSLRRYRAAGWRIEEKVSGRWIVAAGVPSGQLFRDALKVRAVATATSVKP